MIYGIIAAILFGMGCGYLWLSTAARPILDEVLLTALSIRRLRDLLSISVRQKTKFLLSRPMPRLKMRLKMQKSTTTI